MNASKAAEAPDSARPVLIRVDAPQAATVTLVGEFTHWEAGGIPLFKSDSGRWYGTIRLTPGAYQYRLLIDGVWSDHPGARRRVPNAFGSENCVLEVEPRDDPESRLRKISQRAEREREERLKASRGLSTPAIHAKGL